MPDKTLDARSSVFVFGARCSRTEDAVGIGIETSEARAMRIATWNVNSITAHEDRVLDWLEAERPDVLCMQETKVTDQAFPEDGFGDLGYDVVCFGQAGYNGVAIASQHPIEAVFRGFDEASGPQDTERRLIGAEVEGIKVFNVYVPNGQTLSSPQYPFKLAWLERLRALIKDRTSPNTPAVLLGDFNIAPLDIDVWDMAAFKDVTHVSAPERAAFQALLDLGWVDALRHFRGPKERVYTFWDYQALSFERNRGMRIDHILVTRPLLERARSCEVHRGERAKENRSDHAPVVLDLA